MSEILISLLSIYIFIVIGFFLKAYFKDDLHDKTVTLVSVYGLQPFLTFWGLYDRKIDYSLFLSPIYYIAIIFIVLLFTTFLAKKLFEDKKISSIVTVSALIGNTGNLGIPLGIALFGEQSIAYTTMINLANVFFVFTFGVYYYSRGEFDIKESLLNILKLPVIYFAILALVFNYYEIKIDDHLVHMLEMGAYSSIVTQLMIFGIYSYTVQLKTFDLKLNSTIMGIKFILIPAVTIMILLSSPFEPYVKGIILMELIMPLAIMNVNLASLYNCKVSDVTTLVLYSSILFIPIIIVLDTILQILGWR